LWTGNPLLDQSLAICADKGIALSFEPKEMAALPGGPWSSAKAAENWKAGVMVAEILKCGPPEGWTEVEYRRIARRGGRSPVAWVPTGAEPRAAIARALSVAPDEIRLLGEELDPACAPPTECVEPHFMPPAAALSPGPAPTAFATIEPLTAEGAAV
jgi:hypothetical protein